MKRKSIFAILVLIVASIVSCGKDPKTNDPNEPTVNSITFGNYDGMAVIKFDGIQWEFEGGDYTITDLYRAVFDINQDGTPDFELETCATTSSDGTSEDPKDHFDISVFSEKIEFHNEIIKTIGYIEEDTTIIHTDSVPLVNINITHHCELATGSEPESYSNKALIQHNKDEVLDSNDSFSWGSFLFFKFYRDYNVSYYSEEEGAYIYKSDIDASWDCLNFPIGDEFYIGFRFSDKDKEHLGWIKLIIEPDSNGVLLAKPLEAAYQE